MTYYVYELIDPRDGAVFYVGKGKGGRIDAHEKEALGGRVSRKCDKIREIEEAGFKIAKRKVKTFKDEQDAFDFEMDHIDTFVAGTLTNILRGGGCARHIITIGADRETVKCAAELINRTNVGNISGILVNGSRLDLLPILELYKDRAFQVIGRRGIEWANGISRRYSVEFCNG